MDLRVTRGESTRRDLLAAATELFAQNGYEATSIEQVLSHTGISKGSLYHHFASKRGLFEAVLEELEAGIALKTVAAARRAEDPVGALRAGCRAWLRLACDPTVRRIVLLDAPTVVGWERWREIDERHAFGLIKTGVAAAWKADASGGSDTAAHVLFAGMIELTLLVARSDRPRAALAEAESATDALLAALVG